MDKINKKRLLVADAEIFNLATLIGTLKDRYHVVTADSGAGLLKKLAQNSVDMILLDTRFPDMDGFELCRRLKADEQTRDIPVIFITASNSVIDEEQGFAVGAADYIAKPYNAPIVLARIKTQLKLSSAMQELRQLHRLALDANPNTNLPGNSSILKELQRALNNRENCCVVYADLDHFKAYNDNYGFAKGDDMIVFTATSIQIALHSAGCSNAFIGHIGGDDFVFVVPTDKCPEVTQGIIRQIERDIPSFYEQSDVAQGYIEAESREGGLRQYPLASLSMGGVDLSKRHFDTIYEIIDICTETKCAAKKQPGSNILLCQRESHPN